MGRIQSSIGLITGTDIQGTVDQLIKLSAQPRNRLQARTETLQKEQQAIAELTASVIGVQLAGKQLASASTFRAKTVESSNPSALSAEAGSRAVAGNYQVRTLATAATHSVRSLQRFASTTDALGFAGTMRINPNGGTIDGSVNLSSLNGGRGVDAGIIRLTDRSGTSAEVDLSAARTMNDVIEAINDADVSIRATTVGGSIQLSDESGSTAANLKVEQLGTAETAADLGIWGIDTASNTATGNALELPAGVNALRGVALADLGGGTGIGPLTSLDVTLSDGSSGSIDLSSATTTTEVIDAIEASGLAMTVRLNDARNGFQLRDVSGGAGSFQISSSDSTAADLGLEASTTSDIVVGENLNLQTVTRDTLLADLNQGDGIQLGSFTITDSAGAIGAVNLKVEGITTVGGLIDAINNRGIGVTAQLNDAGDGIAVIDTAGGGATMTIQDSGSGSAAADLGIAGTATSQTVAGSLQSALVGSQAGVITVEATDTLDTLIEKINEDGRYGDAAVQVNDDGTFSLSIRSRKGGEGGQLAINTEGFSLDLRTDTRGQDARIAVSTDGGSERLLTSSDGVFTIDGNGDGSTLVTAQTLLGDLASGVDRGSFTITDSTGKTSAINLAVEGITTVGQLVDALDNLGIGVDASINEDATGIVVVDTAGGSQKLTISDVGDGTAAANLGLAGEATTQTIDGASVSAIVGKGQTDTSADATGLTFTLKELSDSPINVTVNEDAEAAVSAAKKFVEQYNKLVEKLDSLTFYDETTQEVGLLFGSSEALRIRNSYNRLLSGSVRGAGDFRSIGQVGLGYNDQGKLELDSEKLREALNENQVDVEAFFTTEEAGLADRLEGLADRIAGESSGMLLSRAETLGRKIEFNNTRIGDMNERLENERERLLMQFYRMEEAIAKIQSNQAAISQIQPSSAPT